MNTKKSAVSQFSDIGVAEIPATDVSLTSKIEEVFRTYPDKFFTQRNFVCEGFGKRNPQVHQSLMRLLEKGTIFREGSRKKYFYKLK